MLMGLVFLLQGDEADCMYFIEDGEVSITVKNKVINDWFILRHF